MHTQSNPTHTHAASQPRPVAAPVVRPATYINDKPMGFTRRELRRLVAEMIG